MRIPATIPAVFLTLGLSACTGDTQQYTGHNTYEYFPLDGARTWLYTADVDTPFDQLNVDYNLAVSKTATQTQGATQIVTLEYRKQNTGDLLYSIDWSSDSADGIVVHGYSVQGGDTVAFDTPIEFAAYRMVSGDVSETTSNGMTITSTLEAVVDCPNYWTEQVWECLQFHVDDGDGDDSVGVPFGGTWEIAGSWGASRFRPTGMNQDWVLSSGTWDGAE